MGRGPCASSGGRPQRTPGDRTLRPWTSQRLQSHEKVISAVKVTRTGVLRLGNLQARAGTRGLSISSRLGWAAWWPPLQGLPLLPPTCTRKVRQPCLAFEPEGQGSGHCSFVSSGGAPQSPPGWEDQVTIPELRTLASPPAGLRGAVSSCLRILLSEMAPGLWAGSFSN